jgi:hypothetical protein
MNRVLKDFANSSRSTTGSGFFDGDLIACEMAIKMSKSQKRKLVRYDIIPVSLFQYLAKSNVIKECDIPKEAKTKGWFLDFLRFYPYPNEEARSVGEYLFRAMLTADYPFLARSFAKGDYVWKRLLERWRVQRSIKENG